MAEVRRRRPLAGDPRENARRIREVENLASGAALSSQDEWTPLTFENGFSWGAGEEPGFYLDEMGRVWLRGIVQSPASPVGKVVATLPMGWRPLALAVFSANQGTSGNVTRIDIEPDGSIRFVASSGGGVGAFSLDGFSWRVENEGEEPVAPGGGETPGGGGALKYVQTVGDGTEIVFGIIHGLGTSDVVVQVFDVPAGQTQVLPNILIWDANTVLVEFGHPPAAAQMKVVVIG